MSANSPTATVYDDRFFSYTSSLSFVSAQAVVPVLRDLLPEVESVVDFGCAQGVWLKAWADNGISDLQGVDGDYVDRSKLLIPVDRFQDSDLNQPVDLKRRFDLAYSFEVAEHLRPESSEPFVRSLTRHADTVVFSAAPPGQGGESHINERSLDSWHQMFAKQGYVAFDCVRPRLQDLKQVAFWYRYNIILYVHRDQVDRLSDAIQATRIEPGQIITDVSPPLFKLRKGIVRLLPQGLGSLLARLKARLFSGD